MNKIALYELAAEYQKAAEQLSMLDLDEQTIQDTLEGLSGDFEAKAANVAMFVKNLQVIAESKKQAEEMLHEQRMKIEIRIERIREYLKNCMLSSGLIKMASPYLELSIKNNPPSVEILDEQQIPPYFMVYDPAPPPKPNKLLIKERLKNGQDIPGAKLQYSVRLEIK